MQIPNRKKIIKYAFVILVCFCLTACSSEKSDIQTSSDIPYATDKTSDPRAKIDGTTKERKNLIVYFSRVGNTDFPEGIDAISSASLLFKNDSIYGNTQYLANLIQESTQGDLSPIQVKETYPANYDETVDRAENEKNDNVRLELSNHIDNIEDYAVVFLGFPNWWYDMPMPVYSFLDEYDLSGKTIIPFCTNGGSGFSNSIDEIQSLEPKATVINEGLAVSHTDIDSYTVEDVQKWLETLDIGIQNEK